MSSKEKISVVIPVYNGSATLKELTTRCIDSLSPAYEPELIFVNDASTDNSWEEIKAIKKQYPELVKGINLATNIGQHQAIFTAFSYCLGEWTVTIDDDLQHTPEDILQLVQKQEEGNYDLVYGMYEDGKKHAAWRNAGSKMVNQFFQKNANTKGFGSPFRLIHKSVLERLLKQSHQQVFLDVILQWNAHEIGYVPVAHYARKEGKSGYGLFKLIKMVLSFSISYTAVPLRLMTYTGLISSVLSFGVVIFYIWKKYYYGANLGFTALITAIFLSTGIIMFCLGIIGEYIRRIFMHLHHRPTAMIKEIL